jgi:leader peptidase (prepilin peptidase) / N-methyltransferase
MTTAWSRWSGLTAGTAGAALAGITTALVLSPGDMPASAFLGGAMAAIAAEDVRRLRVPDGVNAFAAVAGLAMIWIAARTAGHDWLAALGAAALAAALCGGALYIVREAFYRLRGFDGLGFGDVKLGATAGIWLGWEQFPFAVLIAATGALAYVVWRTAADGIWPKDRRIPFAAFLAPAIWLCWLLSRRLSAL